MKKFLLAFLAAALLGNVHAATIVVEADDDNGFSRESGANLLKGNLVRVGYFDISDSVIATNKDNVGFLDSHFVEFGIAHIGDTYNIDEHFASVVNRNTAGGSSFDNKQIALWVFAANNPNSADTFVNIQGKGILEHGIFYADMAQAPTWRIRPEAEIPNATTIDITDLTNAAGTGLSPAGRVVVGTFPNGASDALMAPNFGLVTIVPEPSTVLALLGGAGLLFFRRRRA
jgi:hypothetical protein